MTFCSRQGNDSADEVALFCLIAMEFVRYVEARHGGDAINSVVGDVGAGGAIWDAGSVGVVREQSARTAWRDLWGALWSAD